MSRYSKLEIFLLAALAGFSGLFLLLAKDYGTTAALFPRVIASASLAFIILDVVWEYLSTRGERAKPQQKPPDRGSKAGWAAPFALQGGYIALIYVAGFATATFLYLLACPWQLRYRNWIVTIVHAVLVTFAIVYTFHSVFHVRLPKGMLGIPW